MHPNEQMLRNAVDCFVRGDLDELSQYLEEDIVVHVPGNHSLAGDYKGRDSFYADFIGRMMEITGGTFQLEPHDILASDDHAVGIYMMRAQRDGKSYEWRHVNVYHVRDGKIFETFVNPFDREIIENLLT